MRFIRRTIQKLLLWGSHGRVSFSSMNKEQQRSYLQREAKEFIRRYGRVIDALAKE